VVGHPTSLPQDPIKIYDTHPNKRFAVGDRVVPLDPEEPPVIGVVIGHSAEDRVWVEWGAGRIASQEDVDEIIGAHEWSFLHGMVGSGNVNRPRMPATNGMDRTKLASRSRTKLASKKGDSQMSDSIREARVAGIKALNQYAALMAKNGHIRVAEALLTGASVALSLHQLYENPKTRKASCDRVAKAAMNRSINSVLAITQKMRETKRNPFVKLAGNIDVAMLRALTYPRSKGRKAWTIPSAPGGDYQTPGPVVNDINQAFKAQGQQAQAPQANPQAQAPQADPHLAQAAAQLQQLLTQYPALRQMV
jgi:hypothetical protein